jgi:SAM-dependent methyltransferase
MTNEPKRPQPGPATPEFTTRNPALASFWDERFERGVTPWDQAGVQPAFEAFALAHAGLPVLIPGCGNAWEAGWLADRHHDVRAIDFSPAAVASAREALGTARAANVEQADFFTYEPPFVPGWIFERAFLCALPKAQRSRYAARMAELLPAGGLLAGFFFLGDTRSGPPFGIERAELDALLAPYFELIDDQPVDGSIPVFVGRERWLTWRRRER